MEVVTVTDTAEMPQACRQVWPAGKVRPSLMIVIVVLLMLVASGCSHLAQHESDRAAIRKHMEELWYLTYDQRINLAHKLVARTRPPVDSKIVDSLRSQIAEVEGELGRATAIADAADREERGKQLETRLANLEGRLAILEYSGMRILDNSELDERIARNTENIQRIRRWLGIPAEHCQVHVEQAVAMAEIPVHSGCSVLGQVYWMAWVWQFPNAVEPIQGGLGPIEGAPATISLPACPVCTATRAKWIEDHKGLRGI